MAVMLNTSLDTVKNLIKLLEEAAITTRTTLLDGEVYVRSTLPEELKASAAILREAIG